MIDDEETGAPISHLDEKLRPKTIFFIDNGTLYTLFLEIARRLHASTEVKFIFITLIKARVKFFQANGVEAVYLDLSSQSGESQKQHSKKIISDLESIFSTYRFDLSIKRDRILKFQRRRKAEKTLLSAASQFQDLLVKYDPTLILGEVSWAIEQLFFYISQKHGIRYRHLLNIPGGNLKIVAFDDRHTYESAVESSPKLGSSDPKFGKSYAELCAEVKSYSISIRYFISRFFMNYSRNDYRQALFYRLRRVVFPLYKRANSLFYSILSVEGPSLQQGNILFVLHIQPEATPDFVSPFYSDQMVLAQQLVESLRSDQTLYIKDHPNQVSIRNLFSWWKILRNPRVKLLSSKVPAKKLYKDFDCVVSIAGTALLECSEMGIPALCVSDIFWKKLPGVLDARDFPNFAEAISAAVAYKKSGVKQQGETADFIDALGFPGFIHDARVSPQVLDPENVLRISRLIEHMLEVSVAQPLEPQQSCCCSHD